jgi:general secretion pathway protein E
LSQEAKPSGRAKPAEAGQEVIRALDEIVRRAFKSRASDVHIEPKADRLRIRLRIDGVLSEEPPLPASMASAIVSRVKVLAKMDISERRQPQDGMFKVSLGRSQLVTLRASTFPCFEGEKLVLRLLMAGSILPLNTLGVEAEQATQLRRMIQQQGGLMLVTGPTGSGKTSTLYALLSELDTCRLNIVTLEDPIEVQLPEITQGQVNRRAGFTFASGLRSILRQDPDVILVGEMRDPETAQIALQASLTGHLVLSTLHTNSTIATITRLIDIGLEPYTVANALIGIVAQRLVRTVCKHCAEEYVLETDVTKEIGFPLPIGSTLKRAVGCDRCYGIGFRGRRGIFEIVEADDCLRRLIKENAGIVEYRQYLKEAGVPTMRRAGMRQALKGKTTAPEVLRVT